MSVKPRPELAIKESRGRLVLPCQLETLIAQSRFTELPIRLSHLEEIILPNIHKAPFDRLLIAQARVEKLTLVTRDAEILKYDVPAIAA